MRGKQDNTEGAGIPTSPKSVPWSPLDAAGAAVSGNILGSSESILFLLFYIKKPESR